MVSTDHPIHSGHGPQAVVVGVCAHGLALVRGLARAGIPVIALECNRRLPGFHTRDALVHHVQDINGSGLLEALSQLRDEWPEDPDPVLFLTNDNMVRTVGQAAGALQGYRLSWAHCAQDVLALLDKAALESHCRTHDLPYPQTGLLERIDDLGNLKDLKFPLIAKPTRPLSGFKVRQVKSRDALEALARRFPEALPFLLQQWIPGDDRRIHFTAFYLEHGKILASFDGRKLASHPPAMGQTTVAESHPHPVMRDLAERFFAPLNLSGPVSLEAKLDSEGKPWIIEPTLGRTDYWLDVCVANGVNLPLVEYQAQCETLNESQPEQEVGTIWFDTERSPLSYWRQRLRGGDTFSNPWRARFAYWDKHDPLPFVVAMMHLVKDLAIRITRRVARMMPWRASKSKGGADQGLT